MIYSNSTRKNLVLLLILLVPFILLGCGQGTQQEQIDKISDLAGVLAKASELPAQYARNEISSGEFAALSQSLQDKYEQLTKNTVKEANDEDKKIQDDISKQFTTIAKVLNPSSTIGLPGWAAALGLREPVGLSLMQNESKQTSINKEGFDSVSLVYSGAYEQSMAEAKQIAAQANIPMSKEFKAAQDALASFSKEDMAKFGTGIGQFMKGAIYSNYGLLDTDATIKHAVTLSVDENGKLTIEAIDIGQMKK